MVRHRIGGNLLYSTVVLVSLLAWGVQAAAQPQTPNPTTLVARLSGAST